MKPDFLIIGAQKCATSWLHFHLRQHPHIFMPAEKDVELFSYSVNLTPEMYRDWLGRFQCPAGIKRTGDANAAYFWTDTGSSWGAKPISFNEQIPESIRSFMGEDLQFIVSLRDPSERAVSAYLHHIVHGAVRPEQSLFDVADKRGVVDMGFYAAHLKNWLRVFPPGQFLVINGLPSDRSTSQQIIKACLHFLDLDAFPGDHAAEAPVYAGIPRLIRHDGVWVAAEHPSIVEHLPLKRDVPRRLEEDVDYIRLIDSSELGRLKEIFREDQKLLDEMIRELSTAGKLKVLEAGMPDASGPDS